MDALPGIRRLTSDKVDLYQQKPKNKLPRLEQYSVEANKQYAEIGQSIPDSVAESWFHHGLQTRQQRNIRMGKVAIDSVLDLHGYRQHEAVNELNAFLEYALRTGARFLLIIHGKGFRSQQEAKLRPLTQHWISQQSAVLAYCPAQLKDGGNGASYVYLKKT